MMRNDNPAAGGRPDGFTLIELLVAISLLAVVTGIVYACFASVANTAEAARLSMEELRLRQFLTRSFSENFATAYLGPHLARPGFSGSAAGGLTGGTSGTAPLGSTQAVPFQFLGIDDEDADGPKDAVLFIASSPAMGGLALPGDVKEVRYELLTEEHDDMDLDVTEILPSDEDYRGTFQATETPLLGSGSDYYEQDADGNRSSRRRDIETGYEAPSWTVPLHSLDIKYFDGAEWVDEWDSNAEGRLPWSVHVRVNFARSRDELDAERAEGFDIDEDPDYELIVSIPGGMGILPATDRLPAREVELNF